MHSSPQSQAAKNARSKPDPAVFLLAAERLGVVPERCVVIEDGVNGMIGAREAGMKCIGLVPVNDGRSYPVDRIVRSLSELAPIDIDRLFV